MKVLKRSIFVLILLVIIYASYTSILLGDKEVYVANKITFKPNLLSYNIYKGNPINLEPSDDYFEYEFTSPLFTDYAKKQRLIKLPNGQKLTKIDNELPSFPNGTIIAKTFYYQNDELNLEAGRRVIETRILEKENGIWNVGVYLWNEEQTDAKLIKKGFETQVTWNDKTGETRTINYQVPNHTACTTCHQIDKKVVPIGPKLRMLNRMITVNGIQINQLKRMQDLRILENTDPSTVSQTPNYFDTSIALEDRGRAYLDINCAHCHRSGGVGTNYAFWINFNLEYDIPYSESNITDFKTSIIEQMHTRKMPLIGTTIIDKEGVKLVTEYINSL